MTDDDDFSNSSPKDDQVDMHEIGESGLDIIPGFPTFDFLKHQNKECRYDNQSWTEWSDLWLKISLV